MKFPKLRAELEQWLDENWDTDKSLQEWRILLVEAKWAAVSWPADDHGRDFDLERTRVVRDVFSERKIVGAALSGPRALIADTLLRLGTVDQKARFLQPILTGAHSWCQLFSEPGSGSDLAGATTKAERSGDAWIVNGQKLWTTSAHHADFGFMLARTNWDVPKHQGLSFFLIDMRQPGIEVRPLRQMNGHASFNEVFISNARVEANDLVGDEGDGWKIAMGTLAFERSGFTNAPSSKDALNNAQGAIYDAYRAEQEIELEPYKWYPQRTGRVDLALPRAIKTGKISDLVIRQELAKLFALQSAAKSVVELAVSQARSDTVTPGHYAAIGKLAASRTARQAAKVHTMISGCQSLLGGEDGDDDGLIAEVLLSVPAISIAGGTDEIQKNIIAERILELPKEHRVDTGPFRDVRRNS